MKATTLTLTLSAIIACAAVSIRGQSSASSDESSGPSSGITTKTNQYGAATNEFGAATNKWGSSTNLPPTSTNNLPRIYGTNSPSEKATNSVPDESPK